VSPRAGIEHRDLDESPAGFLRFNSASARPESPQRSRMSPSECPATRAGRRSAKRHAEHAGQRLDGQVVGGVIAIRAMVAERVDRAVDDAGIATRDLLVADAEAIHDARPNVSTNTSAVAASASSRSRSRALFEIQHDAFLAAIQTAEEDGARPVGEARSCARVALGGSILMTSAP